MEQTMDRSTPANDHDTMLAHVRELDGDTFAAELTPAPSLDWFALAVETCVDPIRKQQLRRPTTLDDLFDVLA